MGVSQSGASAGDEFEPAATDRNRTRLGPPEPAEARDRLLRAPVARAEARSGGHWLRAMVAGLVTLADVMAVC
jgi:hypothetical protein